MQCPYLCKYCSLGIWSEKTPISARGIQVNTLGQRFTKCLLNSCIFPRSLTRLFFYQPSAKKIILIDHESPDDERVPAHLACAEHKH